MKKRFFRFFKKDKPVSSKILFKDNYRIDPVDCLDDLKDAVREISKSGNSEDVRWSLFNTFVHKIFISYVFKGSLGYKMSEDDLLVLIRRTENLFTNSDYKVEFRDCVIMRMIDSECSAFSWKWSIIERIYIGIYGYNPPKEMKMLWLKGRISGSIFSSTIEDVWSYISTLKEGEYDSLVSEIIDKCIEQFRDSKGDVLGYRIGAIDALVENATYLSPSNWDKLIEFAIQFGYVSRYIAFHAQSRREMYPGEMNRMLISARKFQREECVEQQAIKALYDKMLS